MLAKPATSVTPLMCDRACVPYSRTSAAKAVSYRPPPMATPSTAQATNKPSTPRASASAVRPSTNSAHAFSSSSRPSPVSTRWPTEGLMSALTTRAMDSAANTTGGLVPSSAAIGSASRVGR